MISVWIKETSLRPWVINIVYLINVAKMVGGALFIKVMS